MKIFKLFRIGMIKKNNFTKYILYAIGEIILIFIGIYLAIWFNNWNENKKLKIEESKIIEEIKLGLENDLDEVIYYIGLHQKAKISCEIILNQLEKNIQYHDSLDLHFGQASYFTGSFPKQGPYESLKSKGFELISNDSLRLGVIDLYEVQFPHMLYVQKFDENNFRIYSDQYKSKFKNWEVFLSATPLDYNSLKTDNYFKEHIRFTLAHKNVVLDIFESVKERIMSTTKMMERELNK